MRHEEDEETSHADKVRKSISAEGIACAKAQYGQRSWWGVEMRFER